MKIDTDTMLEMNYEADVNMKEPATVAKEFLENTITSSTKYPGGEAVGNDTEDVDLLHPKRGIRVGAILLAFSDVSHTEFYLRRLWPFPWES